MSSDLARRLTGIGDDDVPERSEEAWIRESIPWLSLMAARDTYAVQPELWRLGEDGRARTIEDFTHHLRAALAGEVLWRRHLEYSLKLFDARGFPHRWLRDAFATLSSVLDEAFGETLGRDLRTRLDAAPALLEKLSAELGIDLQRPTRYDTDT